MPKHGIRDVITVIPRITGSVLQRNGRDTCTVSVGYVSCALRCRPHHRLLAQELGAERQMNARQVERDKAAKLLGRVHMNARQKAVVFLSSRMSYPIDGKPLTEVRHELKVLTTWSNRARPFYVTNGGRHTDDPDRN